MPCVLSASPDESESKTQSESSPHGHVFEMESPYRSVRRNQPDTGHLTQRVILTQGQGGVQGQSAGDPSAKDASPLLQRPAAVKSAENSEFPSAHTELHFTPTKHAAGTFRIQSVPPPGNSPAPTRALARLPSILSVPSAPSIPSAVRRVTRLAKAAEIATIRRNSGVPQAGNHRAELTLWRCVCCMSPGHLVSASLAIICW